MDTPMHLKLHLNKAMKQAMQVKNKVKLGATRLIQAEVKRVELDERIEVDDQRLLTIMDKMVKQRRDSIDQYQKADRRELADIESAEIEVIQQFLPAALDQNKIDQLIQETISTTGAESMRDMGKVMGILKPQIQGRADAGKISAMVKKALTG